MKPEYCVKCGETVRVGFCARVTGWTCCWCKKAFCLSCSHDDEVCRAHEGALEKAKETT